MTMTLSASTSMVLAGLPSAKKFPFLLEAVYEQVEKQSRAWHRIAQCLMKS
jgi:hypothetical protein